MGVAVESADPAVYKEFAADYYETDLPLQTIEHVYALRPLIAEVAAQLNPERRLQELEEAIAEIGYPR